MQLSTLVHRFGTPLFITSQKRLLEEVERFRRFFPRIKPYYAVKANSDLNIIRALIRARLSFDVASREEMELVLKNGAKAEDIIFAHPIKPPRSLIFARRKGVRLMTFDSEYELDKINRFYPGVEVLVRIKVPNVGSMVELSIKFGADPVDAIPLLIKAHRLGLKPVGVCFHVGSQCTRVQNYVDALEMSSIIVRDAQLKQIPLKIVDIGGGFPISYFDEKEDNLKKFALVINREIDRLFDSLIQFIAEPGRVLVGPASTLVMRVIGKSIRANKHWYYLDDGLYGGLSGIVYDHGKYKFKVLAKGPKQLSTLAGPTCDSLDIISTSEELPELEVGDIVYVENIGAYSLASATSFNGLPPPRSIFLKDN